MSISKNIKKLLVTGAAVLMAASAGANLNNVNAKRRGRYHYRIHRTYKHKARRSIRRYRARKPRRARRRVRRARRYRPKARRSSKRNMFSYFSSAEIKHLAKLNGDEPVKEFKSDCISDNNNQTYGPAKAYNIDGSYTILNNTGVHYLAKINHMSVKRLIKNDVKHASKWSNWDGTPTKLNIETTKQDIIKDLNKQRASVGSNPVTSDSVLGFMAQKRAEQQSSGQDTNFHYAKNGSPQTLRLAYKYNLPYGGGCDENVGEIEYSTYEGPAQSAKEENSQWGPEHKKIRDDPNQTKVGIGISNGSVVEDFL